MGMFDITGVELSGFKDIDEPAMSNIQSVLGKYVRKFSGICPTFEKLTIKMKIVHGLFEKKSDVHRSEKYEIHTLLAGKGRLYTATTTDKDLIFAITSALDKIKKEMEKKACPA